MQAKFSMEFTLAIVAIERQAGLGEFTTDMLNRTDVRAMMGKVDYAAYDAAGDGYTNVTTLIDVMLQDGQVFSGRADHARGSTKVARWTSRTSPENFVGCAAYCRHPHDRITAIEIHGSGHWTKLETADITWSMLWYLSNKGSLAAIINGARPFRRSL